MIPALSFRHPGVGWKRQKEAAVSYGTRRTILDVRDVCRCMGMDVLIEASGGASSLTLRLPKDDGGRAWSIRFGRVFAYRFIAEYYGTLEQKGAWGVLDVVDHSAWLAEFAKTRMDTSYAGTMDGARHFAFAEEDFGTIEILAEKAFVCCGEDPPRSL